MHATWKPIGNLFQIHDGMGKILEGFFCGTRFGPSDTAGSEWDCLPLVDILEAGDCVELPGVSSKRVTISLMDDTLTLRGETKQTDGTD